MGFQVFIAANVHNMFGRVAEGELCFNKYTSQICIVNAEAAGSTVTLITIYGITSHKNIIFYSVLLSSD